MATGIARRVASKSAATPQTSPGKVPDAVPYQCPECRASVWTGELPHEFAIKVCWGCAAVYGMDPATGPRLLKTQEWHDCCCKAGFNHVWDERQNVIARLTDPNPKSQSETARAG